MTVQTISPSAVEHDAHQDGTGAVTTSGSVNVTAGTHWAGLFLPAVAVGQLDTLTRVTLYYMAVATTHDDPELVWYAQAADDAAVFTTAANDISSRSRTTASVSDSATGIGATIYRMVNIKPLVDEVRARAGWVAGQDMVLIGDGQAGSDLWIRGSEAGSGIWYVEIDYTAAGGGLPLMAAHYRALMNG